MKQLEEIIGYNFKSKKLFYTAMTHSSYSNENNLHTSYERLEFLGDSVLGFVTANELYNRFPDKPEGELTKIRASLVCEENLVKTALALNIGQYLKLGKGEEQAGRQRKSVLSDATEALIAAIYLDGGLEPTVKFITEQVLQDFDASPETDYKTRLQELLQQSGNAPEYIITKTDGPAHDRIFHAEVHSQGKCIGSGEGKSKKLAEQAAAAKALQE